MQCNVLTMWHSAPYMLNKDHLVCSEYTPVVYEGGTALYTIMGYITTLQANQTALIFDNSFTITEGKPPEDGSTVLCDAIKDKINTVVSKTISTLQMEIRMNSYSVDGKLDLLIDSPDTSGSNIPDQLIMIQKWIIKKLIMDQQAQMNEPEKFDPTLYFMDVRPNMITAFLSNWDQFSHIAEECITTLQTNLSELTHVKEQRPILQDAANECKSLIGCLDKLYDSIIEKINVEQEDLNARSATEGTLGQNEGR